jgi:hypothetical protein
MAFKRRFRNGIVPRFRKRRRLAVPVKVIGGNYSRFRMKRFKKRGFFRKKAYGGSRRWTPAKIARCIESKMLQIVATNNVTLTNGLVTTTREFVFCPFQLLLQGTGTANFSNTCCWFKGAWLQFFITTAATVVQDIYVQLDCFRSNDDEDFSAANWTQRTDAGGEATDHYYDRIYGATSTVTDAQNFLAPPNQRGGGPTCIYRRTIKIRNTSGDSNTNMQKVSAYLPFNQIVRFKHMLNATDLTTAPNFWEHGTPVFVIKFYNSSASVGTQSSIIVSGTSCRMYFKDP